MYRIKYCQRLEKKHHPAKTNFLCSSPQDAASLWGFVTGRQALMRNIQNCMSQKMDECTFLNICSGQLLTTSTTSSTAQMPNNVMKLHFQLHKLYIIALKHLGAQKRHMNSRSTERAENIHINTLETLLKKYSRSLDEILPLFSETNLKSWHICNEEGLQKSTASFKNLSDINIWIFQQFVSNHAIRLRRSR